MKEDKIIENDIETFIKKHDEVEEEVNELGMGLHHELTQIGWRLHKTARMMKNPKYRKELMAIKKSVRKTNLKIKKNLKWDPQGLKMWDEETLAVAPPKRDIKAEIEADKAEIKGDIKKFFKNHEDEFKTLDGDLKGDLNDIGNRLEVADQQISKDLETAAREYEEVQRKQQELEEAWGNKWGPHFERQFNQVSQDINKELADIHADFDRFEAKFDTPATKKEIEDIARKCDDLF